MTFLVPNYSCLQNSWLCGYHPQIPVICPLSSTEFVEHPPPPRKKSWVRHCSNAIQNAIQKYQMLRRSHSYTGRHKMLKSLYSCPERRKMPNFLNKWTERCGHNLGLHGHPTPSSFFFGGGGDDDWGKYRKHDCTQKRRHHNICHPCCREMSTAA
jgi:hypothetical protein